MLQESLAQHDHLDQAATYIKNMREKIERLKQKKRYIMGEITDKELNRELSVESGLPVIEVRAQDSILEVVLVTGTSKKFNFYEVTGALEEEGAEVINASFSVVNDKIFYTIQSQAVSSMIGVEASRVSERLKELIQ